METARPTRCVDRLAFAEEAEALGVRTDQIVGTMDDGLGHTTVLYTRDSAPEDAYDPTEMVWSGLLVRDESGVLKQAVPSKEFETIGELFAELDLQLGEGR